MVAIYFTRQAFWLEFSSIFLFSFKYINIAKDFLFAENPPNLFFYIKIKHRKTPLPVVFRIRRPLRSYIPCAFFGGQNLIFPSPSLSLSMCTYNSSDLNSFYPVTSITNEENSCYRSSSLPGNL